MIRTDLLHGEMARAGINKTRMAEKLGITPKTFYAKEKKGVFGSDEIEIIVRECGIKDPMPIFFPDFVTHDATNKD